MVITDKISKERWNDFILQDGGSFLQSFEWGEFQKFLGRKILRIKNNFFQALIIQHRLPFGRSYLYCPRCPVTTNNLQLTTNNFLSDIKKIAKTEKAIFLRVDPEVAIGQGIEDILKSFGFRKSFKEIQPKKTLILDLTKSEEDILAGMHQKTRYNIRFAIRQGVKSQISNLKSQNLDQYFEIFWKLLEQTAKRDKFRLHPKEHYRKLLESIPGANLFLAEYPLPAEARAERGRRREKKVIAANIVIFFGKRATYLHGASDFKFRNLMAPHLLHWEQILEAKKLGCSEYDFWGIDEKKWPGLTRFKKGFNGREVNYVGTWDLVFDKKYYVAYKVGVILTKFLKRA